MFYQTELINDHFWMWNRLTPEVGVGKAVISGCGYLLILRDTKNTFIYEVNLKHFNLIMVLSVKSEGNGC